MSARAEALPRVCVLLATCNGMPWVKEQLQSVLEQRDVEVNVRVSDDGSSDGTREWLEGVARRDCRIQVLERHDRFGSAAANFYHLIATAPLDEYEFFAFADQDDVWYLDKLSRHIGLLRQHKVQAVSSDVLAFWPTGREVLIKKSHPQREWDYVFEPPGPGCSFLMRGVVLDRVRAVLSDLPRRGLQPLPFHDWQVYAVARASGLRWRIDDKPSLRYRQHGRNEIGAHVGWAAMWRRLRRLTAGVYTKQVQLSLAVSLVAEELAGRRTLKTPLGMADILWRGRRRVRDAVVTAVFSLAGIDAAAGYVDCAAHHGSKD